MRIGGMSVKEKLWGRPGIVHVERASDREAGGQRGEEQEKAWLTAEAQRAQRETQRARRLCYNRGQVKRSLRGACLRAG